MRKPSGVIALAIQLEAYAPQFVGRGDFDFHKYQPFLCNVIKGHHMFGGSERYRACHAIRVKLDQHETLFSFWLHTVRTSPQEEFTREWAMQFWQEFIAELQSEGR